MLATSLGAITLLAVVTTVLSDKDDGAPADAGAFDWTVGTWEGVRRGGAGDTAEPMTLRVERILGGDGVVQHVEVQHDGGVYRGFAVEVFDPQRERYVSQYVNATRRQFVHLEGEVEGTRSEWKNVTPGRARESRLVSERVGANGWRRTQYVSGDGGETWRVLWMDELERAVDR